MTVAFVLLILASARAEAMREFAGTTPTRVLEDNPLAKHFYLSFGLGLFEYKTYGVGGWGGDLTYASAHFFSISALGFATVKASSDSTDRRIRPFYDAWLSGLHPKALPVVSGRAPGFPNAVFDFADFPTETVFIAYPDALRRVMGSPQPVGDLGVNRITMLRCDPASASG